jgi:hypothetical protein
VAARFRCPPDGELRKISEAVVSRTSGPHPPDARRSVSQAVHDQDRTTAQISQAWITSFLTRIELKFAPNRG